MISESIVPLLKRIRIGELDPRIRQDILAFASEMGHETSIASSSNLHFLFDLYQAERIKKRRSARRLKKAEKLIMSLAALRHGTTASNAPPCRESAG